MNNRLNNFVFYFLFYFLFLELKIRVSMILYVIVTNCYIGMTLCHTPVTVT